MFLTRNCKLDDFLFSTPSISQIQYNSNIIPSLTIDEWWPDYGTKVVRVITN